MGAQEDRIETLLLQARTHQREILAVSLYESHARRTDISIQPWHDLTRAAADKWRSKASEIMREQSNR